MALREFFSIFLKGVLMGAANILPGISGGTIALITGIYERLIYAINNLSAGFSKIDFEFFLPLLSGILLSFLLTAGFVKVMLENYTALTYSFFFGLVAGSVALVIRQALVVNISKKDSIATFLIFFASLLFAYFFVSIPTLLIDHSPMVLFLSGIAAACTMLLPGISGAYVLVVLGQYEYLLDALNRLDLPPLVYCSMGMLIGLIGFSKLLALMLKRHKARVFASLAGLVLGSLRVPVEKIIASQPDNYLLIIISALFGFSLLLLLEKKASGKSPSRKNLFNNF
ncbi:MAG: DUF368 domain-containing protein [Candidatus Diapherotrites archaeon]|nr:DUF368 domain-containing protein [Candidatus Diapherotrites archaeon]